MIRETGQWPSRPSTFPEILDTTTLAQFLAYDLRGTSVESARRDIRSKVKNDGLPAFPKKIGGAYLFRRQAVEDWLEGSVDNN